MNRVAELAWAAGFLEGEGCFSSSKTCANVVASQKQREPLERLQGYLGGYGNIYSIRGGKYWLWNLYGIRAVEVMFTLYPMLSPRRQARVREVLSLWKLRPLGKGGAQLKKTHCPQGHEYAGLNLLRVSGGRRCRTCRDQKNAARKKTAA